MPIGQDHRYEDLLLNERDLISQMRWIVHLVMFQKPTHCRQLVSKIQAV